MLRTPTARMLGARFTEYARASGALHPIEFHDILKGNEEKAKRVLAKASPATAETLKQAIKRNLVEAQAWLPAAAEVYNISANLKDYLMTPVVIMPSDLPNRNGVGFPLTELSAFNPHCGCLAYQSWRGKPTYQEHKNDVFSEAKGINFDSVMRPLKGAVGDMWKVVTLSGYDRDKDADLANQILTRQARAYSMGAFIDDYECSVCSKLQSKGGCEHVSEKDRTRNFGIFKGVLAYLKAVHPVGFEVSSVKTPAFISADNPRYLSFKTADSDETRMGTDIGPNR